MIHVCVSTSGNCCKAGLKSPLAGAGDYLQSELKVNTNTFQTGLKIDYFEGDPKISHRKTLQILLLFSLPFSPRCIVISGGYTTT